MLPACWAPLKHAVLAANTSHQPMQTDAAWKAVPCGQPGNEKQHPGPDCCLLREHLVVDIRACVGQGGLHRSIMGQPQGAHLCSRMGFASWTPRALFFVRTMRRAIKS